MDHCPVQLSDGRSHGMYGSAHDAQAPVVRTFPIRPGMHCVDTVSDAKLQYSIHSDRIHIIRARSHQIPPLLLHSVRLTDLKSPLA
jgi:hypothetical protein